MFFHYSQLSWKEFSLHTRWLMLIAHSVPSDLSACQSRTPLISFFCQTLVADTPAARQRTCVGQAGYFPAELLVYRVVAVWCAFQVRQITGVNFQQWCPLIYNVLCLLRGGGRKRRLYTKRSQDFKWVGACCLYSLLCFWKPTHRLEEKHSPVITAPLRVLKKASLRLYKQDDGKNNLNSHRTNYCR